MARKARIPEAFETRGSPPVEVVQTPKASKDTKSVTGYDPKPQSIVVDEPLPTFTEGDKFFVNNQIMTVKSVTASNIGAKVYLEVKP